MNQNNKEYKIILGSNKLEVFRNKGGSITVAYDDHFDEALIVFDECTAEKICQYIMAVAQDIRDNPYEEGCEND